MRKSARILAVYLICAAALQLAFGDFPVAAFAFPVNAAVLFAAAAGLWVLFREKPSCTLSSWLISGNTSILLLSALAVSCLVLGLVRQDPAGAESSHGFLGMRNIVRTWWFIAIIIALMANLFMVIISRKTDLRFLLNHAGVLLALAGGFAGASDSSVMRAAVYRDKPSREAFRMDGTPEVLEYELSMSGFTVEDDGSGGVRNYMADVVVDGVETRIRVNHPYGRTLSEDIYLVSYDRSGGEPQYCVLEIVRQPWKYVMWTGIVMMMAGAVLLFARGVRKKEVMS